VPNTLGITTATDAAQERLLKGVMDDDAKLFKDEGPTFDLVGEEAPASDEATRELLEEIDRSLKGFEQAAKTNAWLGPPDSTPRNRSSRRRAKPSHEASGRRVSTCRHLSQAPSCWTAAIS
jgi:hypothetical protein